MENRRKHFYGAEISPYGQENGYVDYETFSKAFNHVLANELAIHILNLDYDFCDLHNLYQIDDENGEYRPKEIFQWFVVPSREWVWDLLNEANEVWVYDDKIEVTLWGVTHYGTSWDYVLTDIKI